MKTTIIADSGSTKTTWCILGAEKENTITTIGLNPFFVGSTQIKKCLENELGPFIEVGKVKNVYFFGSGCADTHKQLFMKSSLKDFFPNASIKVDGDLLGAAIALYGETPGVVAIMGTGSSCGFYNGKEIGYTRPSLGFVLGDEGSGAGIGKLLLGDYLCEEMPEGLREEFALHCPGSRVELLDRVYKGETPNRFLGNLAVFANLRQENPYICRLLRESINSFFEKQLLKMQESSSYQIKIIGSLACHLEGMIRETGEKYGVKVTDIEASPLNGLVRYYNSKL